MRDMFQWVALQATCGDVRSSSGDNRQSPIGPGYSKMFAFQAKEMGGNGFFSWQICGADHSLGMGWKLYASF
jgi:hypothetical protein